MVFKVFSKEARERRKKERAQKKETKRRKKKAKQLAKQIEKGKCADPRAALEEIRKLNAKNGGELAESYIYAAAECKDEEVQDGLVFLYLSEVTGVFDHDERRKLLNKHLGAIEHICDADLYSDEVAEQTKEARHSRDINQQINTREGDAKTLLLAVAHAALCNGMEDEVTKAARQMARERKAKERTKRALERSRELASGKCAEKSKALEEIKQTKGWNSEIVLNLLKFQEKEPSEELCLEASALCVIAMKAMGEEERKKVLEQLEGEYRESFEEASLTELAKCGYSDPEFWARALSWKESDGAVKELLGSREAGWQILADNLDNINGSLLQNAGDELAEFLDFAFRETEEHAVQDAVLDNIEKMKKRDSVEGTLVEAAFGDYHPDISTRAFELLGGKDYERTRALIQDNADKVMGFLGQVLKERNGDFRENVVRAVLELGHPQGMELLAENLAAVPEPVIEHSNPGQLHWVCMAALKGDNTESRKTAFEIIERMSQVDMELLDAVGEHLKNGEREMAFSLFMRWGYVPEKHKDMFLELAKSDDINIAVNSLLLYAKNHGRKDPEGVKEACREIFKNFGIQGHWEAIFTQTHPVVRGVIGNALYGLKEEGGWGVLTFLGNNLPHSEQSEEVLMWALRSEYIDLRGVAIRRIADMDERSEELVREALKNLEKPEHRTQCVELMVSIGIAPQEYLKQLILIALHRKMNDPFGGEAQNEENEQIEQDALAAMELIAQAHPEDERTESCLWSAAIMSDFAAVRMRALELIPDTVPELMGDADILEMLEGQSALIEESEESQNAVKTLVAYGSENKSAQAVADNVLARAKEALESAGLDDQQWAWNTVTNMDSAGSEKARKILMNEVIPELIELALEETDEDEKVYAILEEKYGNIERIIREIGFGGLTPHAGRFAGMLRREDGSLLSEEDVEKAFAKINQRTAAKKQLELLTNELEEYLKQKPEHKKDLMDALDMGPAEDLGEVDFETEGLDEEDFDDPSDMEAVLIPFLNDDGSLDMENQ